jgi:Protein of unknown function (DUF2971)
MAEPTKAEAETILGGYNGLYSRIQTRTSPDEPLLLAHYTSVEVAEKILRDEELWFANPLYMNDLEELRAGIVLGSQLFPEFAVQAGAESSRNRRLVEAFNHCMAHLATEAVLDTYVFCLSEHDRSDMDGLLSMWREYGRKGNGAALVFNTQKITYRSDHPLIITKVNYASPDERTQQIRGGLTDWAQITRAMNLPEDRLYIAAYAAFSFVKSLALATKHRGFSEEREWRVIYVLERDPLGYLKSRLDYFIGPRGVEPKLKYKLGFVLRPESGPQIDLPTGALSEILELIILGPSISSPIARSAFIRMLQRIGKGSLSDRVFSSTIPLRPQT